MTKPRDPEALLSAYLAGGMEVLPDRVVDSVLDEIHRTRQRIPISLRGTTVMAFAVGVAAVALIVVGANLLPRTNPSVVAGSSPTPSASPTLPSPSPTMAPTLAPTPTIALLPWTQASLGEDWPAPVRSEPVDGAVVRPIAAKPYPDPSGDTGSAVHPWVDIRAVHGGGSDITIDLASNLPPLVPPTEQWIAYGVVVDDDRDGIPDRRFGIDNIPATAPGAEQHRAWITDLHTGRTVAAVGRPYGYVGETIFDTFFPGEWSGIGAFLNFGGDTAGGGFHGGLVDPFYAWASVIVDGRVVATDYAPDIGWLDPSLEAKP